MQEITDDKPIEYVDPNGDELVFHHERGSFRRLESKHTRDLATGIVKRPGFFKVLVATKSNRFVFFTMLIVFGVVVFLGLFKNDDRDIIGGINCSLSAFSFDGQVYVTCEFVPSAKKKDDLPIDYKIVYECINSDNAVADKKIESFSYVPKEKGLSHAIFTDYEYKRVKATLTCGEDQKQLVAPVKQR